ncbi:hypothetical protein QTP86_000435 [Hemibagrus guttatus]|nr:hypothetical protein QTP86_000435 [Hemibagrus guttatus]
MGKHKDLSTFDEGQIVMARRLDQSISKTAALVWCSRSAVVSIYQKWSKEGTVFMGSQGSLMHVGSEGCPVWSNPTDKLLMLILLKKLMLVLKERCTHRIRSVILVEILTQKTAVKLLRLKKDHFNLKEAEGQIYDPRSFGPHHNSIWHSLRGSYPTRADPEGVEKIKMEEDESVAEIVLKLQKAWREEMGGA